MDEIEGLEGLRLDVGFDGLEENEGEGMADAEVADIGPDS